MSEEMSYPVSRKTHNLNSIEVLVTAAWKVSVAERLVDRPGAS